MAKAASVGSYLQVILYKYNWTKGLLWDGPVKTIQGGFVLIKIIYFRVLWDAPEEDPGGSMATQKGNVKLQQH